MHAHRDLLVQQLTCSIVPTIEASTPYLPSLPLLCCHFPTFRESNLQSSADIPGWDEDGGEGVIERKLVFCPNMQDLDTDELIKTCPECDDYFVFCCSCSQKYYDTGKPCHHFRLVFTDGACCNNGQLDATAGIGVAYSLGESAQYALRIEADDDPGQKRTSQRAELLAALAGLRIMAEADRLNEDPEKGESGPKRRRRHGLRDAENAWVIATDSEYVAKGITEWFPMWKVSPRFYRHCSFGY